MGGTICRAPRNKGSEPEHNDDYVSGRMCDETTPDSTTTADPAGLFLLTEERFSDLFELERLVANSQQRVLFLARDRVLKRRVALWIHYQPDAESRRWFERETELLASLDHPAIRAIYSAGVREDLA